MNAANTASETAAERPAKPECPKPVRHLHVKCPQCRRTYRIYLSAAKRRRTCFCSRRCFTNAWYAFCIRYAERTAEQLPKAA